VLALVAATPPGPVPERLAAAGRRALALVERSAGDRASALDLLAADALVTLALLAQAEAAPDALAAFARAELRAGSGS
jgi:hypothetical protein